MRSGVAVAALAVLTILSVRMAMAEEGPTRRAARRQAAREVKRDSVPAEIWRVEYRVVSTFSETVTRNPLLEWAMEMKKRAGEPGTDRWRGVAYGPVQPVDPADEQMSIDKR